MKTGALCSERILLGFSFHTFPGFHVHRSQLRKTDSGVEIRSKTTGSGPSEKTVPTISMSLSIDLPVEELLGASATFSVFPRESVGRSSPRHVDPKRDVDPEELGPLRVPMLTCFVPTPDPPILPFSSIFMALASRFSRTNASRILLVVFPFRGLGSGATQSTVHGCS